MRPRPRLWFPTAEGVNGRGVAQPGSASHWGCGGRWFESSRPDHPVVQRKAAILMSSATLTMTSAAAAGGEAVGPTGIIVGILPWPLIFLIFYILMIRPQQKRIKEHAATIAAVKKG